MGEPLLALYDMSDADLDVASRQYAGATPFPHAVFDDALTPRAQQLPRAWPAPDWAGWQRFHDEYQRGKAYCNDLALIPDDLGELLGELSSPAFLRWLEGLTGIAKLIPDPYLSGGGLHESGPGGVLVPHTDFHHNLQLDVFRRVNVLVYLNSEWHEEWGGCLELYDTPDAASPNRVVVPGWGTIVVFTTDDRSVHGFSIPVAEGHVRRSVATYYYTAAEAPTYSGDTTTYWRHNTVVGGPVRRLRAAAYRSLILLARSIAFVAHRLNPKI